MKSLFMLIIFACLFTACNVDYNKNKENKLPVLGEKVEVAGQMIYHTIPDFEFINQDSQLVNNQTFADKVYISDFFFTHCPTICPKMTKQMKRIYDQYANTLEVGFISHSIDPKRDTIGRLQWYAQSIGVENASRWHFVTGDRDEIYGIADDYFSIALEDEEAPEGFDHSGKIILVDKERRVRSFADGTNEKEVDRLMKDIDKLLAEYVLQ